ncbi:MAG: tyrosine-type recombinase/integrase [Gemmatimonadota bacterium]|nr:tyrosine-type recombinase/integrase [Gemmatimonadota bacterium]
MQPETKLRLPARALRPESAECLAGFKTELIQEKRSAGTVAKRLGAARHFLVWLEIEGIQSSAVDDAAIRRFRDHDCTCPPSEGRSGLYKQHVPPPRKTLSRVHRFVRFLENSGRARHPAELQQGYRLVEEFQQWASAQGHTPDMLAAYGGRARHLLKWLHLSRIPMKALTREVLERYFEHDCLCPGIFRGLKNSRAGADTVFAIKKFVRFLAERGTVPDALPVQKKTLNPNLRRFHTWLRQHRGVVETTIKNRDRDVTVLVADLGDDPTKYDAALVRQVLLRRFANASAARAQALTSAMRMYLRFLSSTGDCPASLVGAVPRAALWSLGTLPRYLPMEDIEKVIASCNRGWPVDIRNRAILLLLARLALRAGDVRFLQLNDIDWTDAELHLRGKSRRSVRLPLPQDVGDALLAYIETARPRVPEQTVFLRSRAPHRPFAHSTAISGLVHYALKRAGVDSPNGRGAHVFRHSAATHLLRSGASLETVGALLRHETSSTTQIYAKVDLPMLQQVAQPWMGGVR